MKSYPVMWGLCHKPLPYKSNQYFMESNDGFFPWLKHVKVSSTPPANGKNLRCFFAEAFFLFRVVEDFSHFSHV